MTKTISLVCTGVVLLMIAIFAAPPQDATTAKPPDKPAEAARLNNLGVAYMNQQLFEKALNMFAQAAALDDKLQIAPMNQGIALLNLGRVDAARQFLEQAVKQNRGDPHAWYNLGMLEKNSANSNPRPTPSAASLKSIRVMPTPGISWEPRMPRTNSMRKRSKPSSVP